MLLCRGVLRQRANGLQGRREDFYDLQRRLCRGERGVGVFLKGYVASQASSSRTSALRACKPSFKRACNMLKLAEARPLKKKKDAPGFAKFDRKKRDGRDGEICRIYANVRRSEI